MTPTSSSASKQLKISIVIPCMNAAQYIGTTLLSIQKQYYGNLEVIVVDGSSTDATLEIVRGFSALQPRIQSEPDRGQLDALQKGLRAAPGDIFYWLNADDILMPGTLCFVDRQFREDPALDLLFSDDFAFEESKRMLSVGATIRHFTYWEHLLFYRQMYSECVFWRASKTRFLPESFYELRTCTDYAYFVHLRFGLKEKWVRKRLGAFRIVPNQISERFASRLQTERAFIRGHIFRKHGWTKAGVLARRILYGPRFFALQYLLPRIDRGLRRLYRIATRDRARKNMTQQFFDVWLNGTAPSSETIIALLDH